MSKIIINDEGQEEVVYTQEELDVMKQAELEAVKAEYEAKLADKEAHVKEKLDQFQKAKGNVEEEKEQIMAKLQQDAEEARRLAEEANSKIAEAEKIKQDSMKNYYMRSLVGDNAEMLQKLEEGYGLINIDTATEEDIKKRVEMAASVVGINTTNRMSAPFVGGGYAPNVGTVQKNEEDYDQFKKEFGINLD